MNSRIDRIVWLTKVLLLASLVTWSIIAWRTIRQARQAGDAMAASLQTDWPADGIPRVGTRDKLAMAAGQIESGDFRSVSGNLGPTPSLTSLQKSAAQKFLSQSQPMRERFLAAATAAQAEESGGADVGTVRDALARTLAAAAVNHEDAVDAQLGLAERTLEQISALGIQGETGVVASDAEAVTSLIREIGPAFNLGRDLMTEGHAVAEKLVARASWHYQAKEYRQAASLINLAAGLLGVELAAPAAVVTPKWFDELAESPMKLSTESQAEEAVNLCEAMAMSETPAKPVTALIEKSRRELDANRPTEAYWWASVALSALGMTDSAIATATETAEVESMQ